MPRSRRAGLTTWDALLATVLLGLGGFLLWYWVAGFRRAGAVTELRATLRSFATAAELTRENTGAFPRTPFQAEGFHRGSGVTTLLYAVDAQRWVLVVGHEDVPTTCALMGGDGIAGDADTRIQCGSDRGLPIGMSSPMPWAGQPVAFDAREAIDSLTADAGGVPPEVVVLGWSFSDGTSLVGSADSLLVVSHSFRQRHHAYDAHLVVVLASGEVRRGHVRFRTKRSAPPMSVVPPEPSDTVPSLDSVPAGPPDSAGPSTR